MSTSIHVSPSQELTEQELAVAERKARRFWIGFILLLFAINLGMAFYGVYLASSNKSAAIIPGYYEKSLNWDEDKAEREASQRLGWKVAVDVAQNMDSQGNRDLSISLNDSQGAPVIGAQAKVQIFHHARGSILQELTLMESSPGVYSTTAVMPMEGLWQYNLTVNKGDLRFVWTHEQELASYN